VTILVINCGSSSVKYKTFHMESESLFSAGFIERIGESESRFVHSWKNPAGKMEKVEKRVPVGNHEEGFRLIVKTVGEISPEGGRKDISGIGHRVVHGGEYFSGPTLIDDEVTGRIRELEPLAPLHNPANLIGIETARRIFPGLPQVAVFDTAFHQSMPPRAFLYAIPRRLYDEQRVRRYGFHGTSHLFVAKQAAGHLGKPLSSLNLITLHLGNGASVTAIRGGRSVDTSMGFTPLEGLIMGTRCGDIDPAIPLFLGRAGLSIAEIDNLLNHESGLKGICGTNDMREVEAKAGAGDPQAGLAIDMFCYRVRKYIGAYAAALGRVDGIVFTGGIGENSPGIRKGCCEDLGALGIEIDDARNQNCTGTIEEVQRPGRHVRVMVVKTNEELEIARQTAETIREKGEKT
jgi:acetate kinase